MYFWDQVMNVEELKALIVHNLDVMEFLDILGLELSDLVELLEEQIEESASQLQRACK